MSTKDNSPWPIEEFEQRLRAKDKSYHIHHPFHIAMNGGECTKEQVQGWVLNRFYYQIMIPIKDGAILSNMPDKEHRKLWIQRILDHDGIDPAVSVLVGSSREIRQCVLALQHGCFRCIEGRHRTLSTTFSGTDNNQCPKSWGHMRPRFRTWA